MRARDNLLDASYRQSRVMCGVHWALPILHAHALRVASLPQHHRDPFDQLIVCQAQLEGVPIMTADPQLARYDVDLLAGVLG